jgi:RNA polymerase sigma-70 factor, ECF subfamily
MPTRSDSDAAARDHDIAACIARGEWVAAFEQLVSRYDAKVYRLCVSLLRDPARAQDAAQDSLLRVWRGLPGYDARKASLATWIYAIARNRCLTLLAPSVAANNLSLSLPEVLEEAEQFAAPPDLPAGVAADAQALLRSLVNRLPETQRRSITLFYFEDCSVAETALMLGAPESTVKTHLHRARAALLAQMSQRGLADPRLWL